MGLHLFEVVEKELCYLVSLPMCFHAPQVLKMRVPSEKTSKKMFDQLEKSRLAKA